MCAMLCQEKSTKQILVIILLSGFHILLGSVFTQFSLLELITLIIWTTPDIHIRYFQSCVLELDNELSVCLHSVSVPILKSPAECRHFEWIFHHSLKLKTALKSPIEMVAPIIEHFQLILLISINGIIFLSLTPSFPLPSYSFTNFMSPPIVPSFLLPLSPTRNPSYLSHSKCWFLSLTPFLFSSLQLQVKK